MPVFKQYTESSYKWGIWKASESLEELLEQSDFITIHIPYTDKNRNIIGEDEINVMKDTAVLLNYSRWGIVDEDAVIKALNAKKLRLFITDFSSEKILNHKLDMPLFYCI